MAIKFLNTVAVDTDVLYVDASSNNVGIGTTSPGTKLDVTASATGKSWADYSGTVATFERNGDSNINIISSETGNGGIWFGDKDAMVKGRIRYEHASDKMELWTNNSEKVSITSGGNVGIGTTLPATKLHISPTTTGSTTEEFRIQTGTSSGYGGTAIVNLLTGQYGNSGIYFGDSSQGYSNQPAFIEFQDSPSTLIYKAPVTSGSHLFKIGTAEKMRVNYNGKVGINTTNPLAQLHVDGVTYFTEDFYVAKTGTIGTSNAIEVKVAGTSNGDALIKIGDVNDYWGGTNNYSQWNTTDKTLIHGVDVGINVDPKNMLHLFKGNIYLQSSGIRDANGDYGEAGQNLKSKGQGTVEWSWEKMTLVSTFYASSFQSGSIIYMPVNGTTSETTSNQYYNNFVAPYNGRVRQIRIKHISGSTPTATSFSSFRVYVNGSLTGNLTPTTTSGGSSGMMGVGEYSDTAATFSAGDRVQFAYVASGGTGHIYGATATFIIEYKENS